MVSPKINPPTPVMTSVESGELIWMLFGFMSIVALIAFLSYGIKSAIKQKKTGVNDKKVFKVFFKRLFIFIALVSLFLFSVPLGLKTYYNSAWVEKDMLQKSFYFGIVGAVFSLIIVILCIIRLIKEKNNPEYIGREYLITWLLLFIIGFSLCVYHCIEVMSILNS